MEWPSRIWNGAEISRRFVDHRCLRASKRMRAILLWRRTNRGDPFVYQAGVLPRAHVVGVIDPARECIVVDRAPTPFKPSQKAGSDVAGDLKLDWPTRLLLNNDRTGPNVRPGDQIILIFIRSQPRSLLSIARSNKARSRTRPSRSRKKRTAQICFCVSGRLVPTFFPVFQAARSRLASSY